MNLRHTPLLALATLDFGLHAQTPNASTEELAMLHHATGPFEVKLAPLDSRNGDTTIARMSIDKQFHGALEATSVGEMLSTGNPQESAGYVAIERVTGVLGGRKGGFALMHNATMTQGSPYMNIIVVPGSGSGELSGISGNMHIAIAADGAHSYTLEYTLPAAN